MRSLLVTLAGPCIDEAKLTYFVVLPPNYMLKNIEVPTPLSHAHKIEYAILPRCAHIVLSHKSLTSVESLKLYRTTVKASSFHGDDWPVR